MKIGGFDVPDSLLEAKEKGELVLFAGAGVSKPPPSNYPFMNLNNTTFPQDYPQETAEFILYLFKAQSKEGIAWWNWEEPVKLFKQLIKAWPARLNSSLLRNILDQYSRLDCPKVLEIGGLI